MKRTHRLMTCALPLSLLLLACACCPPAAIRPEAPIAATSAPAIAGFSARANAALAAFFRRTAAHKGRKVAVFDGDGTVFGQTPHYLADECLFAHAKAHPERKPDIIAKMKTQSNVSLPYVQNRIRYLAGLSLEEIRTLGVTCYKRDYK